MSDGPSRQVDRVFLLLGSFDERHRALTLTELAARSGLPITTTHRLIRSLEAAGALERLSAGRYAVGRRLHEIGSLAGPAAGLLPAARPALNALSRLTGHHAQLTTRKRDHAVLVERISFPRAVRVRYSVGGRIPFARTGGGLVLLAFAPAPLQQGVLSAFRPDGEVDRVGSADDLRRLLADIRQTGLLTARQRRGDRLQTLAVPILDSTGTNTAALSVVLPRDHDTRGVGAAVRACAREISRAATQR